MILRNKVTVAAVQAILYLAVFLMIIFSGCGSPKDGEHSATMSSEATTKGSETTAESSETTAESGETTTENSETIPVENKTFSHDIQTETFTVSFPAHIKEINQNIFLISSDADEYPGVFSVSVPEGVPISDASQNHVSVTGGDFILIRMKELITNSVEGIPQFEALHILRTDPNETTAQADLLLTDAPAMSLMDPLSNQYSAFEVPAVSRTWTYMENSHSDPVSFTACGPHPLDIGSSNAAPRLTVPKYNGMTYVPYMIRFVIPPDRVTIREWPVTDMEHTNAQPIRTAVFYDYMDLVELKPGHVYAFTAVWNEQKENIRGFYGESEYVLISE